MDASEQRRIIEALILASSEPIPLARLAQIVPDCSPGVAKDRINELNTEYQEQDRSFEIWEVAGGHQIRTRAEFSGYLQQLRRERPLRLSQAALETLSIIAYKQPVTRGELEMVRGVDTGAVLKGLTGSPLTKIVGHREVPGASNPLRHEQALPLGLRPGVAEEAALAARAGGAGARAGRRASLRR